MKRRDILGPMETIEPEPPLETPPEQEPKEVMDLKDSDVFDLPDVSSKEETVEPEKENGEETKAPAKPKYSSKKEQLAAARVLSLEKRRAKAEQKRLIVEENKRMKEELKAFKTLSKPSKDPIGDYLNAKEKTPPPVEMPEETPKSVNKPYPHKASQNTYEIDYERIINGVRDSFRSNEEHTRQLEEDIRNDERKRMDAHYKQQMEAFTRDQRKADSRQGAYDMLSGHSRKNSVFARTQQRQAEYTERYRSGWYNM